MMGMVSWFCKLTVFVCLFLAHSSSAFQQPTSPPSADAKLTTRGTGTAGTSSGSGSAGLTSSIWTRHVHNGKTYYYNRETGVSSWTMPAELVHQQQQSEQTQPQTQPQTQLQQTALQSKESQQPQQAQHEKLPHQTAQGTSTRTSSTGSIAVETGATSTPLKQGAETKDLSATPDTLSTSVTTSVAANSTALRALEDEVRLTALRQRVGELERKLEAVSEERDDWRNRSRTLLGASDDEDGGDSEEAGARLGRAEARVSELEKELAMLRELTHATTDFLAVTRHNASSLHAELVAARACAAEQESQLGEAHEEIEALEQDLRAVSEKSVKRMRKSGLMNLFSSYFSRSSRRGRLEDKVESFASRKSKAQSAVARRELGYNRTIALLRENVTALSLSLESKEQLVEELLERAEDSGGELAAALSRVADLEGALLEQAVAMSCLRALALQLADDTAALRVRLAGAVEAQQRNEASVAGVVLAARREAAVLLLLERDAFALELHTRDAALQTLRGTNQVLIGQLQNVTAALEEAQRALAQRHSSLALQVSSAPPPGTNKPRKRRWYFFWLF